MHAMIPASGTVVLGDAEEVDPRPDEAVVAVSSFSVNRGETFLLESPPPGWRPGKDVAGVVVQEAAVGSGPSVGSRVVAHPESGGWAERVAVGLDHLAVLPDDVPMQIGAALPLAGLTALRVTRVVGAPAGRRVLLTGASGGVGHYLTELLATAGADVTVVVRCAARGERLRQLGASQVVSGVESTTGTYDVVIESVGGEVFRSALRRLSTHGLFVWLGQASRRAPVLDFFDWSGGSSATIRKFLYTDDPATIAADLATLVRLTASGHLHPEIGLVRPWQDTPAVIEELIARQVRGNAVVDVDQDS